MKALVIAFNVFCMCGFLQASGWNDFRLDIGDGYTVFRANSLDVSIGKEGDGIILWPLAYDSLGPVVGYQTKENYILAKTAGRTPRNNFEGDTFEEVDYGREFFFLIPKATDEPLGPFTEEVFAAVLKEKGIENEKWTRPVNPNFWTPLLGSLMFLVIAIPFLAIRYFYITIPIIILAIWAFRKLRTGKAEPVGAGNT